MRILRPMFFAATTRRLCKIFTTCAVVVFSLSSAYAHRESPRDADNAGDALSRFLARNESAASAGQQSPGFVQQMRDKASDMVMSSMKFLGVPYVRGGTSATNGFDCSGFTRYVFEHSLGLVLPRRADEQAKASGLVPVKRDDLKPGDLVFFNTLRRTFSHVGIYIGEGKFIHAPRPGGEVRVEDMSESYWTKRFTGARRAPEIENSSVPSISAGPTTGASLGASSFTTSTFGAVPGGNSDPLGLKGPSSANP